MNGDNGHLQRLTDEQVTARLAAYNPNGSLERDIRKLWDETGDIIDAEVRAQFGADAAQKMQSHCTSPVDSSWIQNVAEYGRRIYQEKTSVPAYIAARDQLITRVLDRIFERFSKNPETLQESRPCEADQS